MNQYKEDVEIDLVRLFKYLLSKSRMLLLIGFVFGLASLSYKYYDVELSGRSFADEPNLVAYEKNVKQPNGTVKAEKQKASYNQFLSEMERREKNNEVQKSLASYEKATINSELKVLENELKEQQKYMENSVLLNSDKVCFEAVHYYLASEKGVKNSIKLQPVIKNRYGPSVPQVQPAKKSKSEANDDDIIKIEDSALISFARTLLYTDKFKNEFSSALGLSEDTSDKLIEELVTLNKIDDISFSISLKATTRDEVLKLQKVLTQYDSELNAFLKNEYEINTDEISFAKVKPAYV